MVDLAKIRKKAKKALSDATASERKDDTVTAEAGRPTAEPPRVQPDDRAPRSSKASADASAARSGGPETATSSPAAKPEGGDAAASQVPGDAAAISKLDRFKEQAGKRRETKIEQVEQTGEQLLELLTFVIAGEQYAVEIERIVEIVTPRPVTRIPNADPSVLGITSLRGTIVTLLDVRRKLRHAPLHTTSEDTRIVVIELHRETVGFTVDRVLRVAKIPPSDVEPHPVVHSTELEESIRGVFRTGGALTILLDLDKLLDHS